jgi:hypothetical protein
MEAPDPGIRAGADRTNDQVIGTGSSSLCAPSKQDALLAQLSAAGRGGSMSALALSVVYDASPVKRRRATKAEMEERAEFLLAYAAEHGPVTVRGLYYQAEVAAVPGIDKTENAYGRVQRQVLALRRAGRMPYKHISDATRWMRKPTTYDSVSDR